MSKQVQNFIDDARRFQRCSDHDLAISSLQLAQQEDHHKEHEIEIQKLFSLSYRKIGNYNMALLHINNAINQNAKRNNDKQAQNEHAICLMNKGIIYEESKRYDNALDCYISAVDTFISLHKNNPEEHGLIINALLTLGLFYYKRGNFESAKDTLESALTYFGEGRKNDRRYLAICNVHWQTNRLQITLFIGDRQLVCDTYHGQSDCWIYFTCNKTTLLESCQS